MTLKPWLATYRDNGIPETINADAYPSVVHMLDEAMQRYAGQPAFRAFGQTLSYADVDRQSAAFAAWLQQRLGVKKGDRIAVMLPNLLAFPIACIGILRAGAVQVNVNPLYTPRELEHQLKDSGSKTIVIFNGSTPTLAEVATQAGIKTVITVAPGDGTAAPLPAPPVDARLAGSSIALADALRQGASMTRTPVALTGDDLIFLQYTGGTTGLSKGAALSHRNLVAFPRLPVRQWVLSVPKRLRYFMQRDGPVLNMVLRIFLRVIAQSQSANCPGAADVNNAALHIGAVAFIHRFGSSLNEHVHFHVCVVDGVFEQVPGEGDADAQEAAIPAGVLFHPATGVDADAVAQVQATLRKRILRAFVGRGLLESCDAKDMLAYQHSGFSVDAGVCIEAHDRAALERLLRYCARPPFAMERLRKEGAALVYRCAKQRSEPTSDKRGAKADELTLTPLELIDRIAALVPPPRTHRHRYFGVLAPNSPLRAAAVALATPQQPIKQVVVQTEPAATGEGVPAVAPLGHAIPPTPEPAPPKRAPAHYLWAVLIARIYEVFPLLCPICGGQMRLIAFITEGTQIRRILDHIGVDSEPPQISPARGPPLWDDCDAHVGEGIEVEPDWDLAAQPAPDYEVDQRVNW